MDKIIINSLPPKYEDIILPLLIINKKFVLGGSLALYMMNIMDYDFNNPNRSPDLDLSISEPLTEEELGTVRNFFNLEFKISNGGYDTVEHPNLDPSTKDLIPVELEHITKPISHFLTKELIQLEKGEYENGAHKEILYKIDIFNSHYVQPKDIIHVKYKDYTLRLTHPSVILSYKSKYAYDPRVGKQYKHFEDIQKIDWKKYFIITKHICYQWDAEHTKILHSKFEVENAFEVENVLPF